MVGLKDIFGPDPNSKIEPYQWDGSVAIYKYYDNDLIFKANRKMTIEELRLVHAYNRWTKWSLKVVKTRFDYIAAVAFLQLPFILIMDIFRMSDNPLLNKIYDFLIGFDHMSMNFTILGSFILFGVVFAIYFNLFSNRSRVFNEIEKAKVELIESPHSRW